MTTTYRLVSHFEAIGRGISDGFLPVSASGHGWLTVEKLVDGHVTESLDFGYQSRGVVNNDDSRYAGSPVYDTAPVYVNESEYESLVRFGTENSTLANSLGFTQDGYSLIGNNCMNYLFAAYQLAGVIPEGFDASNMITSVPQAMIAEVDSFVTQYNGLQTTRSNPIEWLVDENGQLYYIGVVDNDGEGGGLTRIQFAQFSENLQADLDGQIVGLDSGFSGVQLAPEGYVPSIRPLMLKGVQITQLAMPMTAIALIPRPRYKPLLMVTTLFLAPQTVVMMVIPIPPKATMRILV